jgi:hypothetical protein
VRVYDSEGLGIRSELDRNFDIVNDCSLLANQLLWPDVEPLQPETFWIEEATAPVAMLMLASEYG